MSVGVWEWGGGGIKLNEPGRQNSEWQQAKHAKV